MILSGQAWTSSKSSSLSGASVSSSSSAFSPDSFVFGSRSLSSKSESSLGDLIGERDDDPPLERAGDEWSGGEMADVDVALALELVARRDFGAIAERGRAYG